MFRKKVLTLDKDSESVDSTKYRGMIGSLLYLNASRPYIMFSVCICARFQEDPKVSHLEEVKRIFRKMSNSEESVNEGEMEESSKRLKRKFETMKGYEDDERNTTHIMTALKEARMEPKEMLLSIHHTLKMLLDIIYKMNRKLEDEKIKMNDKGKEKFPNGKLTHFGLEHVYMFVACVVLCLPVASCSQEHLEINALDPWIPILEQGRATVYREHVS
ncbi:hypothetical protein Tco_1517403 [Tanacetum coccineum]